MATLQKIRNHGVFLLVIVGAAMLAFILGDFLNSGSSFFNRSRENIAVIAGHDVHYTEYEAAKDQLTEVAKMQGQNVNDEAFQSQIRNQVWQTLMMEYTLGDQAEKIGMAVTADELSELCIGANPHRIIRNIFADANGNLDRAQLVRFLHQMNQEVEDPEQAAAIKNYKNYWMYWEKVVRLTQLQEKYTALIQGLVAANSLDAKYAFEGSQVDVNAEYVMQPYYTVADSTITISKAELKKLYNQHKPIYKQTPNRAISYVVFDIRPSQADYDATRAFMESLIDEFKTSSDVAMVVNPNSDIMFDGRDYSKDNVPAQYKDFAFSANAKAGQVTELRFANDTYSMARIIKAGYSKPDSVFLKFVATEEGQEDQELGWYTAEKLNKEIATPAFNTKKGKRFTVAVGMGSQTFEVMEVSKATPKVQLAILERKVTPSSKTYSVLYNEAKQFVVNNNTEEAFIAAAAEANKTVVPQYNLNKNTENVGSLTSSRPIVRWAFEAKPGQVSDVFECGDQFVVATLTEVNDGDYRSFEDVKAELTLEAINNKKAQIIINNLKNVESLEQAAEITGTPVRTANHITFNSSRFGNATEPAVVGAALAMEDNSLSAPIQGNMGVYVLKTGTRVVANNEINVEQEKASLMQRIAYMLPYQAISLVQSEAKVTDNRANFY